jgi:hypothetical protein
MNNHHLCQCISCNLALKNFSHALNEVDAHPMSNAPALPRPRPLDADADADASEDAAFAAFAAAWREDLDAEGTVETFLAEQIIAAADRLQGLRRAADRGYRGGHRPLDQTVRAAELSFTRMLQQFERRRARRLRAAAEPPPAKRMITAEQLAAFQALAATEQQKIDAPYAGLAAHLRPPEPGSAQAQPGYGGVVWPMVRDTKWPASWFVSLITDFWSCHDLLLSYPGEIGLHDLRACLEFALSVGDADIIQFVKKPHKDWGPYVEAWGLARQLRDPAPHWPVNHPLGPLPEGESGSR